MLFSFCDLNPERNGYLLCAKQTACSVLVSEVQSRKCERVNGESLIVKRGDTILQYRSLVPEGGMGTSEGALGSPLPNMPGPCPESRRVSTPRQGAATYKELQLLPQSSQTRSAPGAATRPAKTAAEAAGAAGGAIGVAGGAVGAAGVVGTAEVRTTAAAVAADALREEQPETLKPKGTRGNGFKRDDEMGSGYPGCEK